MAKALISFELLFVSSRRAAAQDEWTTLQHGEELTGASICEREIYFTKEVDALEKQEDLGWLCEADTQRLNKYRE